MLAEQGSRAAHHPRRFRHVDGSSDILIRAYDMVRQPREETEPNQLRIQKERGVDLTIGAVRCAVTALVGRR